jgi:hypothetical protein
MLAFFGAMLLAFGISSLNFEHPSFSENQMAYIASASGAVLSVAFFILRARR